MLLLKTGIVIFVLGLFLTAIFTSGYNEDKTFNL